MSDTPPPELVDRLAAMLAGERLIDMHPRTRDAYGNAARKALTVLVEWADDGLIDLATWTVVDAEPSGEWICTDHNRYFDPESCVCESVAERISTGPCTGASLHTLSPRGGPVVGEA